MFSVKKFWISVKKKVKEMRKLICTALRDGGAHVTSKNMSVSLLPWEKNGDAAVSEVLLWDRVSEVLDQEFGSLKEAQWRTWHISPMFDAVWAIAKLVAYLQFVPTNSNAVKYHTAARNWLLHLLGTFKEIWTTFEEILQDPYGQFKSMLFAEIAVLHICNLLILNEDKNAAETLEFKTFFENRCQELVEDDDLVGGDHSPMHSRAGYIAVVQSILKVISTSCTTLVHRSKLDYVQKLVEQWLCDYKHVEQWCSELCNKSSMSQAQTSMDELQIMCSHAHGVIIAIEMRRTMSTDELSM